MVPRPGPPSVCRRVRPARTEESTTSRRSVLILLSAAYQLSEPLSIPASSGARRPTFKIAKSGVVALRAATSSLSGRMDSAICRPTIPCRLVTRNQQSQESLKSTHQPISISIQTLSEIQRSSERIIWGTSVDRFS